MKSGHFAEHSNVLWGISSVKIWDKVNSGLIKMYKAEVCGLSFNYLFLILHLSFFSLAVINNCWLQDSKFRLVEQ